MKSVYLKYKSEFIKIKLLVTVKLKTETIYNFIKNRVLINHLETDIIFSKLQFKNTYRYRKMDKPDVT